MTRKNVYVKIKEGKANGWIDTVTAKNGEEAARIILDKYGDLGKFSQRRSQNPLGPLDDDLPGRSLFEDDR